MFVIEKVKHLFLYHYQTIISYFKSSNSYPKNGNVIEIAQVEMYGQGSDVRGVELGERSLITKTQMGKYIYLTQFN